jgi:hypothetical protein
VSALADNLIFAPPPPSYGADLEGLLRLETAGGEAIAARQRMTDGAQLTVLFAHGNAEDLGDGVPFVEVYARLGVSVLAIEYPGYGESSGRPTEEGTYRAADAAYRHLVERMGTPPKAIVAHGRSLGGAVAVDLASRVPVGGLVIESSFVSAYRVVTRLPILPIDQFRSLAKLRSVTAPVLVMHGEADDVIPSWHGHRLYEGIPEARRYRLWVEGAGHHDLAAVGARAYWRALADFLGVVAASPQTLA